MAYFLAWRYNYATASESALVGEPAAASAKAVSASDQPDLVRTVVMLLRAAALAAATRRGADQLATAEEKINEAIAQLEKLDEVKKTAGSIQKNAVKIENSCTGINSGIQRLLSDALTALAEAAAGSPTNADSEAVA